MIDKKRFNIILFKKAALAIKRSANVSFFRKLVLTNEERNEQGFENNIILNFVISVKKATLAFKRNANVFFFQKLALTDKEKTNKASRTI